MHDRISVINRVIELIGPITSFDISKLRVTQPEHSFVVPVQVVVRQEVSFVIDTMT